LTKLFSVVSKKSIYDRKKLVFHTNWAIAYFSWERNKRKNASSFSTARHHAALSVISPSVKFKIQQRQASITNSQISHIPAFAGAVVEFLFIYSNKTS